MGTRPSSLVEQYHCRRAAACPDRVPRVVGDSPDRAYTGASISALSGLCEACQRNAVRSVRALPMDYVELHTLYGYRPRGDTEHIATTSTPAVPINLRADALQRSIDHEVLAWAEILSEHLRHRRDTQRDRDTRPAVRVQRAVRVLTAHFCALLALPEVDHCTDARDWVRHDGIAAVLTMVSLHDRVRALAGRTRLVHHYSLPCPRCEASALERENGSAYIDCRSCGRRYHQDEFERLCGLLAGRREAAA